MSYGSSPSVHLSSTKGLVNAEWDKVYITKFVRGFTEGLLFFLVENNGNLQIQSIAYRNKVPY
jgi:hypothetical protein